MFVKYFSHKLRLMYQPTTLREHTASEILKNILKNTPKLETVLLYMSWNWKWNSSFLNSFQIYIKILVGDSQKCGAGNLFQFNIKNTRKNISGVNIYWLPKEYELQSIYYNLLYFFTFKWNHFLRPIDICSTIQYRLPIL